jgi:hypothetical protein
MQERHTLRIATQEECAHAVRTAELVRGRRHRVGTGIGKVHRNRADCLHRIGVQGNPVLVGNVGEFGHGLHGPDLVVRPHHADERDGVRVRVQLGAYYVRVDPATRVHRKPGHIGLPGRVNPSTASDARCSTGCEDPATTRVRVVPRPEKALDGQVVGFGSATAEDDL